MGLFASIILTPEKIPAGSQFLLNKAIANGVASFLESKVDRKMHIKWPNDILAENEKVAGILIESNIRGAFFSSLVVGIGINLNHQVFHGAFETPPVSLKILTGTSYEPETVVKELYDFVRKKYNQFIDRDYEGVEEEYRSRIYKRGELAVFSKNGKYFSATLTDVDDNGSAVLQVGDTVVRESHPEVRFAPGANR
jgi:BirA family biotin operon repressor/biotin-[acetyl-CoA-carboxylase] ligase